MPTNQLNAQVTLTMENGLVLIGVDVGNEDPAGPDLSSSSDTGDDPGCDSSEIECQDGECVPASLACDGER